LSCCLHVAAPYFAILLEILMSIQGERRIATRCSDEVHYSRLELQIACLIRDMLLLCSYEHAELGGVAC
jgi:hypothetical protein